MWDGAGDTRAPHIETIDEHLGLLVGDVALSTFEGEFSDAWRGCMEGDARAFLRMSAVWRVMQKAAEHHAAEYVVVDIGSALHALNRAALLSSDYLIVPVMPYFPSLQGLQILGPKLREWRQGLARTTAPMPCIHSFPAAREERASWLYGHAVSGLAWP